MRNYIRMILLVMLAAAGPASASALASLSIDLSNPRIILPLILFIELPAAIYISGFMTKEDRRTLQDRFSGLLFMDMKDMSFWQILYEVFLGENSITMIAIRIWIAFVGCLTATYVFSWTAPTIAEFLELPIVAMTTISLTIFSYVFIRNLCESRFKDQIGHAALCVIWTGGLFGTIRFLINQTVFGPGVAS